MYSLTEGALDKIMNGIEVDRPILQILGHKKLSSSNSGERYRLLVSDGKRINSFTMLATQLNSMITDNVLTEFSICQINRYAISVVNNAGKQKRVMVILSADLKVAGDEVGHKIGNPTNADADGESKPAQSVQSAQAASQQQSSLVSKYSGQQSSTSDISTIPIVALSPYQNRWVIKARVVNKSTIRTWSNSRGEGKLFSMDLVDESGEIRCTAFRDQCDKFYDMIEIGKVYYISRATLKTANKQFNNLKNDYEMTLTGDSEIIPCHDIGDKIPTLQFDFIPINNIEQKEKNDIIDVLAIVKSRGDLQMLVSRTTGKDMKKRDINLIDESNTMVTLTLWGTQAEEFSGNDNPVLAIKGARVGEFNGGKNLSTLSGTAVQVDPDIPEAHRLRGWFNTTGCHEEAKPLSRAFGSAAQISQALITIGEANSQIDKKSGPEIFTVKATINLLRTENILYKSCPSENCKKKVIDQANGMYRCEKCNKEFPNFKYRLLGSLSLADWTDNMWVTAFNDETEKILGITAQELGELKENDNDAYLEKLGDVTFKSFIFKIRTKMETFGDENRLRSTCIDVSPIDCKAYSEDLITKLKELTALSTEDKLEYNFYPVASGQLQFRIKAPNDAHIALTTGPHEGEPMYEVFIGGWSNSKSVIRKNRTKPDVAEADTPGILSADETRGFWIRWGDGVISVGKEGEPSAFLTYADPEPFGIGYFGVCTGWGASGEWLIEGHGPLSTRNELVYTFRNVRSGSVLIEVRAKSNAHIALTNKKGDSSPMYEIMLGGWENTASIIRYDRKQPDKVRVNTPNLLNENETKKFAICWLDGRIMVRAGDVNGPVIMEWQDPKPIGVSYVGVRTGWGATGKWKLRTAQYPSHPPHKNVNPSAPPPPSGVMDIGEFCWCEATGGIIPPGAVEGGKDVSGESLYVGRAYHEGALLPGKVKPGDSVCYVAWGGEEHGKTDYQVLCGCNPMWVPTTGNNIPHNAIPSGESEDGEPLYAGRVQHEGAMTIGKVQPSHNVCYIAFGGAEIAFPEYEIMVKP